MICIERRQAAGTVAPPSGFAAASCRARTGAASGQRRRLASAPCGRTGRAWDDRIGCECAGAGRLPTLVPALEPKPSAIFSWRPKPPREAPIFFRCARTAPPRLRQLSQSLKMVTQKFDRSWLSPARITPGLQSRSGAISGRRVRAEFQQLTSRVGTAAGPHCRPPAKRQPRAVRHHGPSLRGPAALSTPLRPRPRPRLAHGPRRPEAGAGTPRALMARAPGKALTWDPATSTPGAGPGGGGHLASGGRRQRGRPREPPARVLRGARSGEPLGERAPLPAAHGRRCRPATVSAAAPEKSGVGALCAKRRRDWRGTAMECTFCNAMSEGARSARQRLRVHRRGRKNVAPQPGSARASGHCRAAALLGPHSKAAGLARRRRRRRRRGNHPDSSATHKPRGVHGAGRGTRGRRVCPPERPPVWPIGPRVAAPTAVAERWQAVSPPGSGTGSGAAPRRAPTITKRSTSAGVGGGAARTVAAHAKAG